MLVLTRRLGECVHIGDEVVVTVLAVSGRNVRLGIEAPTSVPILRSELVHPEPPAAEAAGEWGEPGAAGPD
jgi:carbon storage regulator